MKTYKNIIVATDFSDNSLNAYHYARQIALHLDASLTVVHVFKMPLPSVTPDYPDYLSAMPSIEELEKIALRRLDEFVDKDPTPEESLMGNTLVLNHVNVKKEAVMGIPADTLIEYSKNPSTDLLVLGTGAEHDWVDKVFGSFAIKVMKEAQCPVLLVPIAADYKGIDHILYTAALESTSENELSHTIDFANYFKATLHFVHVDAVSQTPQKDMPVKFQQLLRDKKLHSPYTIDNIAALTVAEGINAYCAEKNMDLVITVTHHRRFWEDLMHYSVAKELAWQARLPILCFHRDDDEKVIEPKEENENLIFLEG